MMFWILAAVVMAAATLSLVIPLARRPEAVAGMAAYDREIYLARLREIDTDLELGRIGPAEAEAARAEEGRRLLATAEGSADRSETPARSLGRPVAIAALLILPIASIGSYIAFGQPGMPDMELATRQDRDPAAATVEQLIERAEAQLQRNPDDVRGWSVVAPIYMRMSRFEDAARAWRNAVRLEPGNADFHTAYGEALVAVAAGVVTEEAKAQFIEARQLRQDDPKAAFYLALGLGQQGALAEAEAAWRALIAASPADAPWLTAVRQQLVAVLERAGKPVDPELVAALEPPAQSGGTEAAPGPSAEDVQAASEMSPQDRQQMIEGMVERLAARMKDDPGDKEGWLRLIRAYGVLGRAEEGRAAIADARRHFATDTAFLAQLEGLAQGLGANGATQ